MRVRQQRATGPTGGSEVWIGTISFIVVLGLAVAVEPLARRTEGRQAGGRPGVNARLEMDAARGASHFFLETWIEKGREVAALDFRPRSEDWDSPRLSVSSW